MPNLLTFPASYLLSLHLLTFLFLKIFVFILVYPLSVVSLILFSISCPFSSSNHMTCDIRNAFRSTRTTQFIPERQQFKT